MGRLQDHDDTVTRAGDTLIRRRYAPIRVS